MTKIVYTPKDADGVDLLDQVTEWPLDMDDLFVGETKLLEKVLKRPMGEIVERAEQGYTTEMFALVWIQRKRHEPQLHFTDLDTIPISWLSVETDEDDEDDEDEPEPESDEDVPLSPQQKAARTRAAKKAAAAPKG